MWNLKHDPNEPIRVTDLGNSLALAKLERGKVLVGEDGLGVRDQQMQEYMQDG